MAGPLMAVGRALLGSELVSNLQNAGYLPSIRGAGRSPGWGSNVSLGQLLSESAAPMGRLMGLLPEEPPNYNLPTDYYVGPQGQVLSSEGERMVTGQGVSGFQPENQYGSRGFEEPRYEPPVPWNYSMYEAGNIPSQIQMSAPAQEFPPQRTYSFERDLGGVDTGSGSVSLPPAVSSTRPDYLPPDVPWPPPPGAGGGFMPAGYGAEQGFAGPVNVPDVYRGQLSDLSVGLPAATPYESVEQELERLRAKYAAEDEREDFGGGALGLSTPYVDPNFMQRQQAQQR